MEKKAADSATVKKITVNKWSRKQTLYLENHRESWNQYQREYKNNRYATDPEYRESVKKYQRERYRLAKEKQAKGLK